MALVHILKRFKFQRSAETEVSVLNLNLQLYNSWVLFLNFYSLLNGWKLISVFKKVVEFKPVTGVGS